MPLEPSDNAVIAIMCSSESYFDFKSRLDSYSKSMFFTNSSFSIRLLDLVSKEPDKPTVGDFEQVVQPTLPENYHEPVIELWEVLSNSKGKASLKELYEQHTGKISDKWSSYLKVYDEVLSSYAESSISLLEIGVQNGGSLEIWDKYFPNAEILIGCDVNPQCKELSYDQKNISVIVGDAGTPEVCKEIIKLCPKFDIVIDDGSHDSSDCLRNLRNYYKYVKPGGVYILEDLHCSYWADFGGGLFDSKSIINRLKEFVDYPNYEFWGHMPDNLVEKERRIGKENSEYRDIESISFYNSIVIIKKALTPISLVGKRVITGSKGLITGDEYVKNNHTEINRR